MYAVLKLSLKDIDKLVNGGRIEIYKNTFLEFDNEFDEDLSGMVRAAKRSAPKKYATCPVCNGDMIINDTCCRTCDGSARVLVRPEIFIGDKVIIKKFIMSPWGWLHFPLPTAAVDRVNIPHNTPAIVVDIVDTGRKDQPDFMIDCVIDDKLYRLAVEGQYVETKGAGG